MNNPTKLFSKILNAEIKDPRQILSEELSEFDLTGFRSGIYSAKHHEFILNLGDNLPEVIKKNTFLFSTGAITSEKK